MKKLIYLIPFVFLVSCGTNEGNLKENAAKPVKVTTAKVIEIPGSSSLHYSGTVIPYQSIALTFRSAGTVEKVLVNEGDMVKKGQILAVVEQGNDKNIYDAANAKYNQAKDGYERLKGVHEKGSLPEVKWVEMETNLKQAESQLEIARTNLDNCVMRAPESGMIGRRNTEPGQSAISPTAAIELVSIDQIYVKIPVPENEISRITKGQKALFTIQALGGKPFEGEVSQVGIVADVISRTYEVRVLASNPDHEIKPGMVCDVFLTTGNEKMIMVVPCSSVTKDSDGNTCVYVANADTKKATRMIIRTGNYNASGLEVLSGLTPGQTVVVDGKDYLTDNCSIEF